MITSFDSFINENEGQSKALYRLANEYHEVVKKHHEAQLEYLATPKDKIALREQIKGKMLQLHREAKSMESEFMRHLIAEEGENVYEAEIAIGYGPTYQGNYFSMANSYPTTGYSLSPVAVQLDQTANDLVMNAKGYDENENPDHTGHGYMQESLNYFTNKVKQVYLDKMADELPLVNDVFAPRYKGSDVASSGGVASSTMIRRPSRGAMQGQS